MVDRESIGVPEDAPPGSEGLDRALDIDDAQHVVRNKSGSDKRKLSEWGALLGKALTVFVIAAATAWNGVNTYFATTYQQEVAQEVAAEAKRTVKENEEAADEGYKLLARTVNIHTDQLERLEGAIKRIEDLADYLEWKHEQDAKRYGATRLDRMIARFVEDINDDSPPPPVDQEELIARIVTEMAERQEKKRGARIEMPAKPSHIPEEPEFFK